MERIKPMNKLTLRLGIMTNQELADWFGIKEKSLRSTRKKKLEKLKDYAIFEDGRGQVNIIKILRPVYEKKCENKKMIKEKTIEQWDKSGLDTCKFVKDKIINKYDDEINLSEDTIYTYVCNSKRELYGKAFCEEGERGYCKYELCKKINGKCVEFNDEEIKIKNKLLKKYFGSVEEKTIFIQDMINEGEITEEEAWKEFNLMADVSGNYIFFISELEELIKNDVVKATRIYDNEFKTIKNEPFEF